MQYFLVGAVTRSPVMKIVAIPQIVAFDTEDEFRLWLPTFVNSIQIEYGELIAEPAYVALTPEEIATMGSNLYLVIACEPGRAGYGIADAVVTAFTMRSDATQKLMFEVARDKLKSLCLEKREVLPEVNYCSITHVRPKNIFLTDKVYELRNIEKRLRGGN
jgi:hypothetical protein